MKRIKQKKFPTRISALKDFAGFFGFVVIVIIGTVLINSFVFRSFVVSGHSMDHTLADGDRLVVNRLPSTIAAIKNETYIPKRGQVIVFKNPRYVQGMGDEYIVKRVIAYPGERVVVHGGVLTVYTPTNPAGFEPDSLFTEGDDIGPQEPTSGEVDVVVPEGNVFVAGDNRIGENSFDSRSGLGTIPSYDIIGPVSLRIFPFADFRVF